MLRGWAIGLALCALAVAAGPATMRAEDEEVRALEPGKPAPALAAAGWLNGAAPKPDEVKGKVLLVDFFAHW